MEGMEEAGPLAMAVPTSVTAPAVLRRATAWPPAGTKERARSGVPESSPLSSAQVATGADHVDAPHAAQKISGGGDEPALGDSDADEQHGAVGGGRLQLHQGVP